MIASARRQPPVRLDFPSLSLPIPSLALEKRMRRADRIRDYAYGCYAVLGLASLWAAFWTGFALFFEGIEGNDLSGFHGYMGFLVILPLFIPVLAALAIGSLLSLILQWRRKDLPLLALLGLTALVVWLIASDFFFQLVWEARTAILLLFLTLVGYGSITVSAAVRYYRKKGGVIFSLLKFPYF